MGFLIFMEEVTMPFFSFFFPPFLKGKATKVFNYKSECILLTVRFNEDET